MAGLVRAFLHQSRKSLPCEGFWSLNSDLVSRRRERAAVRILSSCTIDLGECIPWSRKYPPVCVVNA
jgi:hypothetical protein